MVVLRMAYFSFTTSASSTERGLNSSRESNRRFGSFKCTLHPHPMSVPSDSGTITSSWVVPTKNLEESTMFPPATDATEATAVAAASVRPTKQMGPDQSSASPSALQS